MESEALKMFLLKNKHPIGLRLLRRPELIKSFSRISQCTFYNSAFFEVGFFYKPTSSFLNVFNRRKL
jgi:hypothetical protein